jgi:large subunit ribosomal protein L17
MRHKRNGSKLGRDSAHREALLMNLAASLIQHGRIETTVSKAKALRPYVEKLVTTARGGDLQARRQVARKLHVADTASARKANRQTTVQKLMQDIAPRFADRPGGYTRILKLGPRYGDAAPMAYIEWVDFVPRPKESHSHAHAHTHDHEHEHAHA